MTVEKYIRDKFCPFGVTLNDAEIFDMTRTVRGGAEMTDDLLDTVNIIIAKYIPHIIARPDVSEGGFSLEHNREALRNYYSFLCKKYSIQGEGLRTITDATDSW
jgi:hypothetical protein